MSDTAFVVTARVKEYNRDAGLRTDGEFVDALNEKIGEILDQAHERARDNGRGTVRPHDL